MLLNLGYASRNTTTLVKQHSFLICESTIQEYNFIHTKKYFPPNFQARGFSNNNDYQLKSVFVYFSSYTATRYWCKHNKHDNTARKSNEIIQKQEPWDSRYPNDGFNCESCRLYSSRLRQRSRRYQSWTNKLLTGCSLSTRRKLCWERFVLEIWYESTPRRLFRVPNLRSCCTRRELRSWHSQCRWLGSSMYLELQKRCRQ